MTATFAPYTVIVPARLGDGRARTEQPSTQVFVRRRLLVAFVFIAIVGALWVGGGSVLANRGGAPASTSAVRPATTYVVQPGDSWSVISRATGVPVSTLQAANPGKVRPPSYVIYVGEVLCIPDP